MQLLVFQIHTASIKITVCKNLVFISIIVSYTYVCMCVWMYVNVYLPFEIQYYLIRLREMFCLVKYVFLKIFLDLRISCFAK